MTPRFSPPFSAPDSPAPCEGSCRCCLALRRARTLALFDPLPEWNSPLTPGVQAVNLSGSEDGRSLRADLGLDWPRMFSQLPLLGPGLVVTRHAAAILGRRMSYPELSVTRGCVKGASGESGLWLDFRRLGSAMAWHRRRETGHVFSVEFSDETRQAIHCFSLSPGSDLDAFFDWVRLHQACSVEQPGATDADSAPEDAHAFQRPSDSGALIAILAACREQELPVRVTVTTPAVRHRATFVPTGLQHFDDWWFASDDHVGLHFQPKHFAAVEVVHGRDDSARRPALRCRTEQPHSALLVEPGEGTPEAAWLGLLHAMA